ncbi:MAG: DUF2723 domain-containing protein [Deltaproteobacteria bacterium]|nr:DUF2723 domain-containing protein [Candidatus Zymogenaceae bacterium]
MPDLRFIRNNIDTGLFGFVFLVSFFVYLLTLCPTVYWRDSAEFVDAAFALAIPHPAGFPSYMPMANLLTYLPFGSIAFKVNLLSAFMGAGAAVMVAVLIMEVVFAMGGGRDNTSRFLAAAGALTYAFSFSLWESSVSAEVYAGMAAAGAGILFCLVRWAVRDDRRYLIAGGFLYGLSAGIHATVALFLPAVLVFIVLNLKRDELPRRLGDVGWALLFFAIGFSVYMYLPIRSLSNPRMDWGNPETLEQFFIHITDRKDSAYHFAVSRGGLWSNISRFVGITASELTVLWSLVSVAGLLVVFRKNWRMALLFLLYFLGHVSFFIWYWQTGSIYTASYVVPMMLAAVAFYFGISWIEKRFSVRIRWRRVGAVVLAAFVMFTLAIDYGKLDKSNYWAAERLAAADYTGFDRDALVLTSLYWPFFYYFKDVERLREDLHVVPVSDCLEPEYFNRVTPERFPGIEVPDMKYTRDTGIDFMLQLMGENISSRTVYLGPDRRIVEKLSNQLVPELFFFRVVTDDEAEKVDADYCAAYLTGLHDFVQRELDSRGGEFFADEVYRSYYSNNFLALSTYLVKQKQWLAVVSVARMAEIVIGPVPLIKRDLLDALTMLERYDEAEDEFIWFLERYPNVSLLLVNYGYNLFSQGRYDDAAREFSLAVEMGDINAEAYLGLGIVFLAMEQNEEAVDALRAAREAINENTSPDDREKIEELLDELSR